MSAEVLTIFTLASARSGTLYLRNLFHRNVRGCVARHETFFDWGNPTMFGRAIYDAHAGHVERVRELLSKKRDYILRLGANVYLESSHAFLKSAYVAALDVFPDLRLVHLIRNPLHAAKSEARREQWRRHAPFHHYKAGDGQRHFVWSLTGREEIYRHFDGSELSSFQRCLIQWIEIENRAMSFVARHGLHDRCFTLLCPDDLNDARRIRAMFEFFSLPLKQPHVDHRGRKHRTPGRRTEIDERDLIECGEVVANLPDRYLEIFRHAPYANCAWAARLLANRARPVGQEEAACLTS
jgi:hypothetical protein